MRRVCVRLSLGCAIISEARFIDGKESASRVHACRDEANLVPSCGDELWETRIERPFMFPPDTSLLPIPS